MRTKGASLLLDRGISACKSIRLAVFKPECALHTSGKLRVATPRPAGRFIVLLALALFLRPGNRLPHATPLGLDCAFSQAMNFTVEGKITRQSPGKFTISTEANIIFHVRYDEKTEIHRSDGSKGSSKDLQVGIKVRVDGELTESGEIVAQKIELQPSKGQGSHAASL